MKKTLLITTVSFVLILLSGDIFAQNGRGNRRTINDDRGNNYNKTERMADRLDLTDDQQTKLSDMRIVHMKDMLINKNAMTEKRARLNTLRTAENIDMKAINACIDDIADISSNQMKNREAHHQEVRNILTEPQKVKFDNFSGQGRGMGIGNGNGRGNGMGIGNGMGNGNGRGNGNRPCLNDGQRKYSRRR